MKNQSWVNTVEDIITQKQSILLKPVTITTPEKKSVSRKFLAGFLVEEKQEIIPGTEKEEVHPLNMYITRYEEEKLAFKLALQAKGIEPIAFLPASAWEKICQTCEVFRFENFSNGNQVMMDSRSRLYLVPFFIHMFLWMIIGNIFLAGAAIVHGGISLWLLLSTFSVLPILSFVGLTMIYLDKKNSFFIVSMGVILQAFAFFGSTIVIPELFFGKIEMFGNNETQQVVQSYLQCFEWTRCIPAVMGGFALLGSPRGERDEDPVSFLFKKLQRLAIFVMPKRLLLYLIFPEKRDCSGEYAQLITLRFPSPPDGLANMLKSLEGAQERICLAIEESAVNVSRNEVHKAWMETSKKEKEKDPIPYFKSRWGNVIAILGQYGEFSKEKKAIEMAKKMKIEECF